MATIAVAPSGGPDDTTQLQNAISAAVAGDTIYFQRGDYITTQLSLKQEIYYRGDNFRDTTLRQKASTNGVAMLVTPNWLSNSTTGNGYVQISDLTIDGNKAQNTGGPTTASCCTRSAATFAACAR